MTLQAIQTGLLDRILPTMLNTYRERREALCTTMDEQLADCFVWEKPVGGMFVWAESRNPELDTSRLLSEALKAGVCVSPSVVFDPEGKNRRALRLNFTLNPPERLVEGIHRLAQATQSLVALQEAS